ncbi:MAG: hypothetical protein JST00_37330 [Deltaproteobacteria bacterium]|nr:hypothetical protein [Deltaproteobacteria bacterium]
MTFERAAVAAGAAMTCALVVLWPTPTWAEEIPDDERMGELSEEGMKFGAIAVRAELVADAKTPGGWVLVRTMTNDSNETQSVQVEERIMRAESLLGARVDGTPEVASATIRSLTLRPHEKKTIGIALPESIGRAIAAGRQTKALAEHAQASMWATERGPTRAQRAAYDRTYAVFHVEYLKPLPPGATPQVAAYRNGPGRMPDGPSMEVVTQPGAGQLAAAPSRPLE